LAEANGFVGVGGSEQFVQYWDVLELLHDTGKGWPVVVRFGVLHSLQPGFVVEKGDCLIEVRPVLLDNIPESCSL